MPYPIAVYAAGGGSVKLMSYGIKSFMPKIMAALTSPVAAAVGLSEIIDLYQDMFDTPDDPDAQQGLEEIAKSVAHLLNDSEILWPTDREGEAITPRYLTIDLNRGRAWYAKNYYSKKSVDAGFRRGASRGRRSRQTRVTGTTTV